MIATIKAQFGFTASAEVYLHNPPVNIDDVTTKGLPVLIHIEPDIIAKKYDFMMGDMNTNPYKIATVSGSRMEIGPNVDAAFICICTYAVCSMFQPETSND